MYANPQSCERRFSQTYQFSHLDNGHEILCIICVDMQVIKRMPTCGVIDVHRNCLY